MKIPIRCELVPFDPFPLEVDLWKSDDYDTFITRFLSCDLFRPPYLTFTGRRKCLQRNIDNVMVIEYFEVPLRLTSGEMVGFRFLRHDLYMMGFRPMDGPWIELSDWIDTEKYDVQNMPPMTTMRPKLGVDYGSLQMGATTREKLRLGKRPLWNAIKTLASYVPRADNTSNHHLKSPLLTVIQMTSEAIRFPEIRDSITFNFEPEKALSPELVKIQNDFSASSKKFINKSIQEAEINVPMNNFDFNDISVLSEPKGMKFKKMEVEDAYTHPKIFERLPNP